MTVAPYTRSDVEQLARKVHEFRARLDPGEERLFTHVLRCAARQRQEVSGYDQGDAVALGSLRALFNEIFAPFVHAE